ncbi:MAG: hypothetical protein ABR978_08750 [Dehalococcoidia bacterium]
MELRVKDRQIRIDQLSDEIRGLPGLSRLSGVSACGPSEDGEILLTLHVAGEPLTSEEEKAIAQAVAQHQPDAKWGASAEEMKLDDLLARSEGSLTLADLESAVRLLAGLLAPPAGPFTLTNTGAKPAEE